MTTGKIPPGGILLLLLTILALSNCEYLFDIDTPQIVIIRPEKDVSYFGTLPCSLRVTDNRKVEKVELFLEDESVHEFTKEPYVAEIEIPGDTLHTKTLKVVANDQAGNWREVKQDINAIPSPFTTQIKRLLAPNAQAGGYFGCSVAISGDYAIVGAINAGAAYSYRRTGAKSWDDGTKIMTLDTQSEDYFGCSVAISGDYAIVGAYGDNAGGIDAGAAYVFLRTGANTWDSGAKIVAPNGQAGDYFGCSVAISGDYTIVGAYGDDAGGADAGAAYVFKRTGANSWDSGTKVVAPSVRAGDDFGYSVGISGDYAIVGAYRENTGGTDTGAAYFFK